MYNILHGHSFLLLYSLHFWGTICIYPIVLAWRLFFFPFHFLIYKGKKCYSSEYASYVVLKLNAKPLGFKRNNIFRLLGGQYTQWNKNSTVWKILILKKQVDICSASKGFFFITWQTVSNIFN